MKPLQNIKTDTLRSGSQNHLSALTACNMAGQERGADSAHPKMKANNSPLKALYSCLSRFLDACFSKVPYYKPGNAATLWLLSAYKIIVNSVILDSINS
jgi:hypothetical protein